MIILTNEADEKSGKFTLTINANTAPVDIMDVVDRALPEKPKNDEPKTELRKKIESYNLTKQKKQNMITGRLLCFKKGIAPETVTDDMAMESYNIDLTLKMLDAFKELQPESYGYLLAYLHAKNSQREKQK